MRRNERPEKREGDMYNNTHSMGNKQEEQEICVQSQGHDIIAIAEMWWNSSYDWNAGMDGCVLFRKDIPGKVMERLILDVISMHVEEKVTESDQHRLNKGKSCLTSMIAFYDGMTGWIDEGRAVDIAYLDFSKAFVVMFVML
ncbi:rna-directed dna polymerase from mobile element jockey- hypothetical protein [Limosa lapponica baueri]|uniref:Rna-directed dna polymerase from mobile element jockey-like n=1 Tax=Limosa lapponica baueri TaxID=1758121 RepID=A0A2I0UM42_LIMLA|nr:rna-directed dna polymerase from mobile element jockey- hypothetical protein [Limosa lapponica baueri]